MPQKSKKKYVRKTNGVCVTVYHPEGRSISEPVQRELTQAAEGIVKEHGLLLSVNKS